MLWLVVIWGVAGAAYLLWYAERPSKTPIESKSLPNVAKPPSFHRVVFTHPGMCNRDVGNESSPFRVCHVTLRINSQWKGLEVKEHAEVTDRRSGRSKWYDGRGAMADCLEWAAANPEQRQIDSH